MKSILNIRKLKEAVVEQHLLGGGEKTDCNKHAQYVNKLTKRYSVYICLNVYLNRLHERCHLIHLNDCSFPVFVW